MISAQEIREKTFEKSLSGYNMGQVDEFLDQIVADISAMAKENAALKGKMRVLVEKVEEYRQTEDAMRLALLSAQKASAQIESEAQQKADSVVAQAKDTADRLTRRATEGIANEEAKLEEAKKATDKFLDHMRAVCQKQIDFYDKLGRMQLVGGDAPRPAAAKNASLVGSVQKKSADSELDSAIRSVTDSASKAALGEPEETLALDGDAAEEEPTRRIGDSASKKRREYGELRFSDEV